MDINIRCLMPTVFYENFSKTLARVKGVLMPTRLSNAIHPMRFEF